MLIDDITYEPYVEKTKANLMGYNIYCDGVQINKEVVTETSFGELGRRRSVTRRRLPSLI
ncbi:MAG: hypothetical protein HDS71_00520 [Bacteroidales bacterium]|nr:hypothetical protein [Bacteroidales bacterium]